MMSNDFGRPAYPENVLQLAEQDAQLQALSVPADPSLPDDLTECSTYADAIGRVLDAYADRDAIGRRAYSIGCDRATGHDIRVLEDRFDTLTYGQLHDRIKSLAMAWREPGAYQVSPGDFVCILGSTGIDYATVDLACAFGQAVSVPLQATSVDELAKICASTSPTAIAAAISDLAMAVEIASMHPSIRSIIAFDYDPAIHLEKERFEAAEAIIEENRVQAQLVALDHLLVQGEAMDWQALPPAPEGMDRLATLIHSSGSTGQPKGVMHTGRLSLAIWATKPQVPVVRVAYAPMNHMMGRAMIYATLARGGTAYVTAKSDLSELFDDIRLARPTELNLLPRLLEVAYRHYQAELSRYEVMAIRQEEAVAQVMSEMGSTFLGDRLCALNFASAPVTQEIQDFARQCFRLPLDNSYGMTEAGGILYNGKIMRPPIIDYRLRDVPALGYFANDKPFPRGELCIRSRTQTAGYFKQPEATAQLFDDDGYLLTGDIMEERAPDHLVYLERANDVLKLSQGEFVPIAALGGTFEAHCEVISQIYLYGNSARSYLVAVIVPDLEAVRGLLGEGADDVMLGSLIRRELKRVALEQGLRGVDIPRDFILEYDPFTFENGLLTSVGKRRRAALKARYYDALEQLYGALEEKQAEDLRGLRQNAQIGVREKLIAALELSLGIQDAIASPDANFADLGGDSLGAATYAALLSDIFDVDVSINSILSPAGSIDNWTRTIEMSLAGGGDRQATFASVHGGGAGALKAGDLKIGSFFDAGTLDHFTNDPPTGEIRNVLLTGATGFLGRFLCLEWLEKVAARGGKLICLVRAANSDNGFDRLSEAFTSDPEMAARFASLAQDHFEALVGDVGEPALGLAPATFDRLARDVDHIVHCGALVNHVLPYEELFAANVAGTAEIARLALTGRQKAIDYISSLAVVRYFRPDLGLAETTPLMDEVPLSGAHMRGYALSKWAGEQLLHNASAEFGLPVNIFRCDMILADRRYRGQINVSDSFTRTIYSLALTGSAPKSFYELAPDGARQPAHYDGLPADFAAAAIAEIGDDRASAGVAVFHVVNHHGADGVSLDSFVDWIEEAGYPIDRQASYDRWLQQFEIRLRALPEEQRQRSLLPILSAYARPDRPFRLDDTHIDSKAFVEAVRASPMRRVPHLDRALLVKYLQDLRSLDYLPQLEAAVETS